MLQCLDMEDPGSVLPCGSLHESFIPWSQAVGGAFACHLTGVFSSAPVLFFSQASQSHHGSEKNIGRNDAHISLGHK